MISVRINASYIALLLIIIVYAYIVLEVKSTLWAFRDFTYLPVHVLAMHSRLSMNLLAHARVLTPEVPHRIMPNSISVLNIKRRSGRVSGFPPSVRIFTNPFLVQKNTCCRKLEHCKVGKHLHQIAK